jgi:hypothetical protein
LSLSNPTGPRTTCSIRACTKRALNYARGILDCSPTSQYHNSRFKAAAEELGLFVVKVPHYGWAYTKLEDAKRARYADLAARLESVLVHRRMAVLPIGPTANAGSGGKRRPLMPGPRPSLATGSSRRYAAVNRPSSSGRVAPCSLRPRSVARPATPRSRPTDPEPTAPPWAHSLFAHSPEWTIVAFGTARADAYDHHAWTSHV